MSPTNSTANNLNGCLPYKSRANCTDNNHMEHNHHEEGPNHHYSHVPQNVDRNQGIMLVILEYDGKMQPEAFMDWLVCVKNVFSHKPMTDDY